MKNIFKTLLIIVYFLVFLVTCSEEDGQTTTITENHITGETSITNGSGIIPERSTTPNENGGSTTTTNENGDTTTTTEPNQNQGVYLNLKVEKNGIAEKNFRIVAASNGDNLSLTIHYDDIFNVLYDITPENKIKPTITNDENISR